MMTARDGKKRLICFSSFFKDVLIGRDLNA